MLLRRAERKLQWSTVTTLLSIILFFSVALSQAYFQLSDITFWLLEEWLAINKVVAENIVMCRYYAGNWTEFSTNVVGENAMSLKFNAETLGFSIFTVTAKTASPSTVATGVEGYVKDEAGKPVSGVEVAAFGKTIAIGKVSEAKTDEVGHYFMEIPPGEYVLVFSALGYADGSVNFSLSMGEVKRIDYVLEFAAAEFLEDWGGVKFELAFIGNLTWEVCGNATVKVSATVQDMGGNMEVEFRQLKLYLVDAAVSQTVPINVRLSIGGLAFSKETSLAVLYGFQNLAPGSMEVKELKLTLEGSYVDKYGNSWLRLSEEGVNVKVYAPQAPVSVMVNVPETIYVDDEFNVTVKLKNEGRYQIKDVNLRLETPAATSPMSPLETGVGVLNPGEEFTTTFRLRAEAAATSTLRVSYSFRTLWENEVWQPSKALGSIVISKVPTSISITVEPQQATVGESISVKGQLKPAINALIVLIVKEPDGSIKTFNTTSYLDGAFTFTIKLEKEGKYTFTARFPGDAKHQVSTSSEAYVEAKPAPALLWLYAAIIICAIIIVSVIAVLLRRRKETAF
jgi:hypothetical protein